MAYKLADCADFSTDTVFKVTNQYQETIYLKNITSVDYGAKTEICNPVGSMDIIKAEGIFGSSCTASKYSTVCVQETDHVLWRR